jgi:hypothetical protein
MPRANSLALLRAMLQEFGSDSNTIRLSGQDRKRSLGLMKAVLRKHTL